MEQNIRPEEVIVNIYRQKAALLQEGKTPSRVILSRAYYDMLQRYHANLGELKDAGNDYITKYTIFGIPVYLDDTYEYVVESDQS